MHPCLIKPTEDEMYGLISKITAVAGKREELIAILLYSISDMPGCLSYIVARDTTDAGSIWVTEAWDNQASHEASLVLSRRQGGDRKRSPSHRRIQQSRRDSPGRWCKARTVTLRKDRRYDATSWSHQRLQTNLPDNNEYTQRVW
jgi:quinol monooxygenase YgiN